MIFQLQCEIGDALKNNDDGEENAGAKTSNFSDFLMSFMMQ